MKRLYIFVFMLLCLGCSSCSKDQPLEKEEEVTPFDYNHLWYGNWLVEESSGKVHEGLFDKGDSFSGEVKIFKNKTEPSTCYLSKVNGTIQTTINFELDVDRNILSDISVRVVDFGGDSLDASHIKLKSIPGSFTVTQLDENNMHLKMAYSDGAEWIVKMKKTAW